MRVADTKPGDVFSVDDCRYVRVEVPEHFLAEEFRGGCFVVYLTDSGHVGLNLSLADSLCTLHPRRYWLWGLSDTLFGRPANALPSQHRRIK